MPALSSISGKGTALALIDGSFIAAPISTSFNFVAGLAKGGMACRPKFPDIVVSAALRQNGAGIDVSKSRQNQHYNFGYFISQAGRTRIDIGQNSHA
jgi:hypothetical protein